MNQMTSKFFVFLFALITASSYTQEKAEKEIVLADGWYRLDEKKGNVIRSFPITEESFSLSSVPSVEVVHFESYKRYVNSQGNTEVVVFFDATGKEKWRIATKNSVGYRLVFVLDNTVFYAPYVSAEITAGVCVFTKNNYNHGDWQKLEEILAKLKER
jgi:preprotein translocase subunit SecD